MKNSIITKKTILEHVKGEYQIWEKDKLMNGTVEAESDVNSKKKMQKKQVHKQHTMENERSRKIEGEWDDKKKKRKMENTEGEKEEINLFEQMKVDKEQRCLHINEVTITEGDLLKLFTMKQKMEEVTNESYEPITKVQKFAMTDDADSFTKKQENMNENKASFDSTHEMKMNEQKETDHGEDMSVENTMDTGSCVQVSSSSNVGKVEDEDVNEDDEEEDCTEKKIIEMNNCLRYIIDNRINKELDIPQSNNINALFMDFYHLIMAYTYFKQEKHNLKATFEIYFRKCPFEGKYAVLAGTDEVIKYINSFRFTKSQLDFVKNKMSNYEDIDLFIEYLSTVSGKDVSIFSMEEGSVIFANEPVMIVEGNILVCQLLESAIINLINYPTLIATNSLRYKISINCKTLAEFGCRRAQGPDGALTGSKYSSFGCDFTSNVYASYLYNIPLLGTMSHSFILSFQSNDVLNSQFLNGHDFLKIVEKNKKKIHELYNCEFRKENELKAFVAFGQINPENFICLIDTYDCLRSGIFNFLIVALSLYEINFTPIGVRIDSGDLRYLSNECQLLFEDVSKKCNVPFTSLKICVSNDINEKVIKYLNEQKHNIGVFAIGTNLVTCQSQPSLGLIYKLVQINDQPCFKMTNENNKSNLPYKKNVYRLFTNDNYASIDYVQLFDDPPPMENQKLFCINVLDESKKCFIIPKKVEKKLQLRWNYGKLLIKMKSLKQVKKYTWKEIKKFRNEHFRSTLPIPYKVSFSENYHQLYKNLLLKNSFIATLT